jgi:hypothetical protein
MNKKKKKKKQEAKYTSRPQRGHVTCGWNGHHFISCSSAAPFLAATFQNTLLQHGTRRRSLAPPSITTKVSKISHKPSHQHLFGLWLLFWPPPVSYSLILLRLISPDCRKRTPCQHFTGTGQITATATTGHHGADTIPLLETDQRENMKSFPHRCQRSRKGVRRKPIPKKNYK